MNKRCEVALRRPCVSSILFVVGSVFFLVGTVLNLVVVLRGCS